MNVTIAEVIAERIHRNDSVTFIRFLSMLHQMISPRLRIHLIMDNGSSHTSRAKPPPLQMELRRRGRARPLHRAPPPARPGIRPPGSRMTTTLGNQDPVRNLRCAALVQFEHKMIR
jgi:hypothetical protein